MRGEHEARSTTNRRAVVSAALFLGWILVIIAGSGQVPEDAPLLAVDGLVGVILLIGFGLLLVIGVALIIAALLDSDGFEKPPNRRASRFAMFVFAAIMLALLVWNPKFTGDLSEVFEEPAATIGGEVPPREPAAEIDPVASDSDVVWLLGGIAVLVGLGLGARRWAAANNAHSHQGDIEEDLLVVIEKARTQLADGSDPRSSVLNAYASLEGFLADRELPRQSFETPAEHLGRVMPDLRIDPAPLIVLGDLYELARFSEHEVTQAEQHRASQALLRARRQLASVDTSLQP